VFIHLRVHTDIPLISMRQNAPRWCPSGANPRRGHWYLRLPLSIPSFICHVVQCLTYFSHRCLEEGFLSLGVELFRDADRLRERLLHADVFDAAFPATVRAHLPGASSLSLCFLSAFSRESPRTPLWVHTVLCVIH
jgi:hypothetical protein